MKVINLTENSSLLSQFVAEMRNINIQNDRLRFRRNIERVGEVMAYEISKVLQSHSVDIQTPLGVSTCELPNEQIVLGTILRAGLPFHHGFLNYFDESENSFVSAYRKYKDRLNFDIHIEYIASPDINGKTLILTDPMLATGNSMDLAFRALLTKGQPKHIHLASIIASRPAVEYLSKTMDENVTLWCAAIDPEIDEHSYIIPGLGDAGDLAYGEKL